MLKKIIIIILLIFFSVAAFAETPARHVRLIETDGFYFLWCIEGQEVFTIISPGIEVIIPLPLPCNCNDEGKKS